MWKLVNSPPPKSKNVENLVKLQGDIDDNVKIHFWRDPVLTNLLASK